MAMFIRVDVDRERRQQDAGSRQEARRGLPGEDLRRRQRRRTRSAIVEDNLDECTLCDLCMQASPDGVKVVKLYES